MAFDPPRPSASVDLAESVAYLLACAAAGLVTFAGFIGRLSPDERHFWYPIAGASLLIALAYGVSRSRTEDA